MYKEWLLNETDSNLLDLQVMKAETQKHVYSVHGPATLPIRPIDNNTGRL